MLVNEDDVASTVEPLQKMPKYDGVQTNELYAKLKEVDPLRADHIHISERRKILRSLEVFETTGRPHGEIIEEQRNQMGGSVLGNFMQFLLHICTYSFIIMIYLIFVGGPLRFTAEELAVLWVQCDQEVLDQRCDKRVDKMISEGLLKELRDFHEVRTFAHYFMKCYLHIYLKQLNRV